MIRTILTIALCVLGLQLSAETVNFLGEWAIRPYYKLSVGDGDLDIADPEQALRENYDSFVIAFLANNILTMKVPSGASKSAQATYLWNVDREKGTFSFVSKDGDVFEFRYTYVAHDTLLLVEDADEYYLVSLMTRTK